jgi:hypothetical protein
METGQQIALVASDARMVAGIMQWANWLEPCATRTGSNQAWMRLASDARIRPDIARVILRRRRCLHPVQRRCRNLRQTQGIDLRIAAAPQPNGNGREAR